MYAGAAGEQEVQILDFSHSFVQEKTGDVSPQPAKGAKSWAVPIHSSTRPMQLDHGIPWLHITMGTKTLENLRPPSLDDSPFPAPIFCGPEGPEGPEQSRDASTADAWLKWMEYMPMVNSWSYHVLDVPTCFNMLQHGGMCCRVLVGALEHVIFLHWE